MSFGLFLARLILSSPPGRSQLSEASGLDWKLLHCKSHDQSSRAALPTLILYPYSPSPEFAGLHEHPLCPALPVTAVQQYDMEKQACHRCHRTALSSNHLSCPTCQEPEQAAQAAEYQFHRHQNPIFCRGALARGTRLSTDLQPNSALSFSRAAVEDQSRMNLTTKHP